MKAAYVAACMVLFASQPVLAQEFDRAAVIEAAADAVEEYFFDADRGEAIAAELRDLPQNRAAEIASADRYQLADLLTAILRPHDGHFGVSYSPSHSTADADGPPDAGYGYMDQLARRGHGFSAVEILPGNIGLITHDGFAEIDFANADDPARASADAVLAYVAPTSAVIIDLRDNGGGAPHMVGYLASAFVAPGSDIYNTFISRGGTDSEAPLVEYRAPMTDKPLYILTSPRTGSAAESLAYTLQAAGRATVIGRTSAGAANPGGGADLGQGFELFVSTGSPRNPFTGTNWEGTGVVPDIQTSEGDELRTAQIAALEATLADTPAAHRIDTRWLLEALAAPGLSLGDYSGIFGPMRIETSGDSLIGRIGSRDPIRLSHIEGDLFYRVDWPLERFRFERDADGKVVLVERTQASGYIARYRLTD